MALLDFIQNLWEDDEARQAFEENPEEVLVANGFSDITTTDVVNAVEEINAQQNSSSEVDQGGNNTVSFAAPAPPPPPASSYSGGGGGGSLHEAVQSIQHYNTYHTTTNQEYLEENTNIDNSIRPNITADGDVSLDIDAENTNVTGDDNAVADDGGVANSGDGAVVAGDDIQDSQINTGEVGGSMVGGNVGAGAVLGNENQVLNAGGDVGAAAFGGGDATNVDTDGGNAILGDDNILLDDTSGNVGFGSGDVIDAGGGNVNTGSGDLTNIENSDLDEVAIGGGDVTSTEITADDGSSVAYGAGASSEATDSDVDISGSNIDGNVQVAAGDNADQTAVVDESVEISDSYNTTDSFNTDVNYEADTTIDDHSQDNDYTVDDSGDTFTDDHSDDDAVDIL